MDEVIAYVVSLLVTTGGSFLVVWLDERRLPPRQARRAWPSTTRIAAVFAFGPFCLPVHFWRTRRSLYGLVIGFLYMALVLSPFLVQLAYAEYVSGVMRIP